MDDALVVNDNQVVLVLVFVREVLESCLHCLLPKMRMIYYRVADQAVDFEVVVVDVEEVGPEDDKIWNQDQEEQEDEDEDEDERVYNFVEALYYGFEKEDEVEVVVVDGSRECYFSRYVEVMHDDYCYGSQISINEVEQLDFMVWNQQVRRQIKDWLVLCFQAYLLYLSSFSIFNL